MAFPFEEQLRNYDVYPKVIAINKEVEIHVRPTGSRLEFLPLKSYKIVVAAMDGGRPDDYPKTADYTEYTVKTDEDGAFSFRHTFRAEMEYFIFVYDGGRRRRAFSVFCVGEDLVGRYPFLGDLHMHTNCSDGTQTPEVVCANYRRYGYDFMPITDHNRYYPSLRAIEFYKDLPIEFKIIPGEEVHMPDVGGQHTSPHIVNFGGEYSINALTEYCVANYEAGKMPSKRAIIDNPPPVMSINEYEQMIMERAEKIDCPDNVDEIPAAVVTWVFDEIRKANGLGIFAHPTWRNEVNHVPEVFQDWLFETQPFDAFEVLGGENYFEHNGFQTSRYYEERAKGRRFPVVGSTDSHNSNEHNRNAFICATIVFAPECERTQLIQSIKDYYSVAVDTISTEFRLVGEGRFIRYGCFLLKNYFPLHDELCYEEGRLMKQYATGTAEEKEDAARMLAALCGRVEKLRAKYFSF